MAWRRTFAWLILLYHKTRFFSRFSHVHNQLRWGYRQKLLPVLQSWHLDSSLGGYFVIWLLWDWCPPNEMYQSGLSLYFTSWDYMAMVLCGMCILSVLTIWFFGYWIARLLTQLSSFISSGSACCHSASWLLIFSMWVFNLPFIMSVCSS